MNSVGQLMQVLPLYIGCDVKWCKHKNFRAKLSGIYTHDEQCMVQLFSKDAVYFNRSCEDIRPILRPWSDLKVNEVRDGLGWPVKGLFKLTGIGRLKYTGVRPVALRPNEVQYLCSIGIDLFGLIEMNLAIDSSSLY